MAYYGDGVERPALDRQGHDPDCRVWTGYRNRFFCTCGAVEPQEPRTVPGYSDYELTTDGKVKCLSTGRVLEINNAQKVVRLRSDRGESKTVKLSTILDITYSDLARG